MSGRAPLRKIIHRAIRVRRGPGTYTDESLECGHTYQTDATGAVRKAKQRRCTKCQDSGPIVPLHAESE